MPAHDLLLLLFSAIGAAALYRYRAEIAEAIRRGPWGGGPPPPIGPLGAADPFRRKLAARGRKPLA
jgi:hypothetical protein